MIVHVDVEAIQVPDNRVAFYAIHWPVVVLDLVFVIADLR